MAVSFSKFLRQQRRLCPPLLFFIVWRKVYKIARGPPTAEQQAIDRTHHIEQTKTVFAYKMLCIGTIKERNLKRKKLKISTDIITTDQNFIVKIS